jgi:hypothetical protein
VKEHGLERFVRAFAEAGFVVLVHDHRNFGASDGAIRHDIDPWRQIAHWQRGISFLESLPEVDADRIGVWARAMPVATSSSSPRPTAGSGPSRSADDQRLRAGAAPRDARCGHPAGAPL